MKSASCRAKLFEAARELIGRAMRAPCSMSADYTLREANAGDAEAIAALHTDSWRRTYRGMMTDAFLDGGALENRRRVWKERLGRPDQSQFVCVAEAPDRIIGFTCVFVDEDPVWGSSIDNLHVATGMHRRGIGAALMRNAA